MTKPLSARVESPCRPRLIIGCFATLCADQLGETLVRLSQSHPDLDIGVQEMGRADLGPALRTGEIDFAIAPEGVVPSMPSLRLWRDAVNIAMSVSHPLAGKVRLTEYDIMPLLYMVPCDQLGAEMHRFLAALVMDQPNCLQIDMCGSGSELQLVACREGVMFTTATRKIDVPNVVSVPLVSDRSLFNVDVTALRTDRLSYFTNEFPEQ